MRFMHTRSTGSVGLGRSNTHLKPKKTRKWQNRFFGTVRKSVYVYRAEVAVKNELEHPHNHESSQAAFTREIWSGAICWKLPTRALRNCLNIYTVSGLTGNPSTIVRNIRKSLLGDLINISSKANTGLSQPIDGFNRRKYCRDASD